jgi:hypothetical protein
MLKLQCASAGDGINTQCLLTHTVAYTLGRALHRHIITRDRGVRHTHIALSAIQNDQHATHVEHVLSHGAARHLWSATTTISGRAGERSLSAIVLSCAVFGKSPSL